MMREIKFRGKRVDNNEWVIGDIHKNSNFTVCHIHPLGQRFENYDVIPETVGQYTELKDKNGTEIYEGDCVKNDKFGMPGVIRYDPERMSFVFHPDGCCRCKKTVCGYVLPRTTARMFEVIGNIHNNPELMEAK